MWHKAGADPAILKGGFQLYAPIRMHWSAKKKGGSNPWNHPPGSSNARFKCIKWVSLYKVFIYFLVLLLEYIHIFLQILITWTMSQQTLKCVLPCHKCLHKQIIQLIMWFYLLYFTFPFECFFYFNKLMNINL